MAIKMDSVLKVKIQMVNHASLDIKNLGFGVRLMMVQMISLDSQHSTLLSQSIHHQKDIHLNLLINQTGF